MLTIKDLTFRFGEKIIFDKANITIPSGGKIGLVGKNGSGKTTLFNLILNNITPDEGEISIFKRVKIGAVAQEAPNGEKTVLELVLSADIERAKLLEQAQSETEGEKIAQIHTRLAEIQAHSAIARASYILRGLGFEHERQNIPLSKLSGGWRMRVALASLLFSKPDLLLLDEPTNYLDIEGAMWLENYLSNYPYTVLLISHDRDLLNNSVDSIIHLEGGKLKFYRANYNKFEKTRLLQIEYDKKSAQKQKAKIEHMQKFVDRFRYSAKKAKQAQSRLKMIEKLTPQQAVIDESTLPIKINNPKKPLASPIIVLENVSLGYNGEAILSDISLNIDNDDRIGLLGKNGNGKSSFAKLLANHLKPLTGKIRRSKGLEIAYFAQHQMDLLKEEQSALEHIEQLTPYDSEAKRRSYLAQMGLNIEKMDIKSKFLSGGEKTRLLLGLICFNGPTLLILDEPTNHLDMDSRNELINALNEYEGALLIISHDSHLLNSTIDRIFIAQNGTIEKFSDDISAYKNKILAQSSKQNLQKKSKEAKNGDLRKKQRQIAANKRAKLAPLKKEITQIEQKINKFTDELARINTELSNPLLYKQEADNKKIIELGAKKSKIEKELSELEEIWLEKSQNFEAVKERIYDE